MIEFVISKVLAIIFGFALIGVLMNSFLALDHENIVRSLEAEMNDFQQVLEKVSRMTQGSSFIIELDSILSEGEMLEISDGAMWLKRGELTVIRNISLSLQVLSENGTKENHFTINMDRDSSIFLEVVGSEEGSQLMIHLAKSSTISSSTLIRRWHSSLVL